MIGAALEIVLEFFPTPIAVIILGVLAVSVLIVVFKVVSLVLDAIPFL